MTDSLEVYLPLAPFLATPAPPLTKKRKKFKASLLPTKKKKKKYSKLA